MAEPRGYFTSASLLAFIFLGIIRGTFSVVIHFAVHSYKSPSLVFLLRTPGTVALYALFMVFTSLRNIEDKQTFLDNFRTLKNYWKSAVMGVVQLAAPYMLFMYGLVCLNPTTGGVYMAAAPWVSILLERLPFVRSNYPISRGKLGAICVGSLGIVLVSISGVALAAESPGNCVYQSVASNVSEVNNTKSDGINSTNGTSLQEEQCTPYSAVELSTSLMALMGGCLMWSISSVFWRSKRGNIHFVSAGVGNNLFGGIFALVIWSIMLPSEEQNKVTWTDSSAIFSIIFLTVVSGFLAALLVDYMYKEVGAVVTNRVLCLVPLVAWLEDWIFVRKFGFLNIGFITVEVVGVVLVFVGLTLSSFEPQDLASALQRPLLNRATEEESEKSDFYHNVQDIEDGMYSDEEVKNNSRSRLNPFPPLVEVTRQDQ